MCVQLDVRVCCGLYAARLAASRRYLICSRYMCVQLDIRVCCGLCYTRLAALPSLPYIRSNYVFQLECRVCCGLYYTRLAASRRYLIYSRYMCSVRRSGVLWSQVCTACRPSPAATLYTVDMCLPVRRQGVLLSILCTACRFPPLPYIQSIYVFQFDCRVCCCLFYTRLAVRPSLPYIPSIYVSVSSQEYSFLHKNAVSSQEYLLFTRPNSTQGPINTRIEKEIPLLHKNTVLFTRIQFASQEYSFLHKNTISCTGIPCLHKNTFSSQGPTVHKAS